MTWKFSYLTSQRVQTPPTLQKPDQVFVAVFVRSNASHFILVSVKIDVIIFKTLCSIIIIVVVDVVAIGHLSDKSVAYNSIGAQIGYKLQNTKLQSHKITND